MSSVLGTIQASRHYGQTVSEIHEAFRAQHGDNAPSRDHLAETVGWLVAKDCIVAIGKQRGGETVYVVRGSAK